MASIWEKAISILAGNLNSSRIYLITAVWFIFEKSNSGIRSLNYQVLVQDYVELPNIVVISLSKTQ